MTSHGSAPDDSPSAAFDSLGPPIHMQDALRSHVGEIVRQKEMIRTLLEKFKLQTVLIDEKAERSANENGQLSDKVLELEKTVDSLMEMNENYKIKLTSQNKSKELFQAKVREIDVTIQLLQQREKKTNELNTELKRERDLLQHDLKTLQERFDFETKRETEAAKRRIAEELAAAKTNSDNDAREKALAEKAYKEDLLALKRLSELQEREMAQRIKDDYVPKQEFQQLKEMFDAVVEDKRILEESVQIVDLASKDKETRAVKAEEVAGALRAKLHESEKTMLQAKLGEERAVRDLEISQEEVSRALKIHLVNEERLLTLEREKSMLLSQVANLKFDNSRTNAILAGTKAQTMASSERGGEASASATPAPPSAGRALNTQDLR